MKEQVKLQISLDKEVVQWIEDISKQLGLRSRSGLINRMLLELKNETEQPKKQEKKSLEHRLTYGLLWIFLSSIAAAWVGSFIDSDIKDINDKAEVIIAVFAMLLPGAYLIGNIIDE